jgi:zinc transporter
MTKQGHGHILFSYAFNAEGKAIKLDNEKVAEELRNEGLAWVHLDANKKSAKNWLEREVSYLDHLIMDALLEEETRPRIMKFDNGLLIILRGINLDKNAEPEDMVSIRMWIDNDRIITVQRRNMKAVFEIKNKIEAGKEIKNSGEFLYNLLYEILNITSPFLYALGEKIDLLEEKIMTTHDAKFREEILQARTQSTIFRRYLAPQKDVISKLCNTEQKWITDWAKRHFQENLDHITHMIEEVDETRERSQILHDELANALAERLNKNMYTLSIITAIFMPLTFISGVFGMNIGGVPGVGENENHAFIICMFGMLIVALLQVFFFKKRQLF